MSVEVVASTDHAAHCGARARHGAVGVGLRQAVRLAAPAAPRRRPRAWPLLVVVFAATAPRASCETLLDAVALAYDSNPTLRAQRAQLRATDEGYVQARAGLGAQLNVNGQFGAQNAAVDLPPSIFSPANTGYLHATTGAADLSLTQPLYTSGQGRSQVRGAAAAVTAGRETLRREESRVLQAVITAYMDVRRDREIVTIIAEEIAALQKTFEETKAKGRLGALTRTDVAESEARLLSAEAQLNLSRGRLNASTAEYVNVVGQNPGELAPAPDLTGVPATVDLAFAAAEANNAQLLEAVANERAAREKVVQAKGANGVNVSVKVDLAIAPVEPYVEREYDKSFTAGVVVSKPIFTSGMNSSKIRQALEQDNQARLEVEIARRSIVQTVAQAWSDLAANRSALAIEQRQVEIEEVSATGNRVEERVGLRTTIDLLNAELELANARVSLVQGLHDEYVDRAALLAAMGLLEARYLLPGSSLYDPRVHLDRVRDIGGSPLEGVVQALDGLGSPGASGPALSAEGAGLTRPLGLPPLPAPPPR